MNEPLDSLSKIDNVLEVYSEMISFQSTQFTILISVLCGIVVFIFVANWYWNVKGAKSVIKEEVEKAMTPVKDELKTNTANAQKLVTEEVNKAVDKQNKHFEEEFEAYKNKVDKENRSSKAELYRIFALHCTSTNSFLVGAQWWFGAAELYQETGMSEFVGISVNSAVDALSNCVKSETIGEDDKDSIDSIEASIKKIPDILSDKKQEAKRLIKQVKKKYESSMSDQNQ